MSLQFEQNLTIEIIGLHIEESDYCFKLNRRQSITIFANVLVADVEELLGRLALESLPEDVEV